MVTLLCRSSEDAAAMSKKIKASLSGVISSETFICKNIIKSINPLDCKV
jgi:hypothetical protein